MSKKSLLFIGSVSSRSGYGDHARDILRSIMSMNEFDITVAPIRWGSTPLTELEGKNDDIRDLIINSKELKEQPDISVQVTIPTEFQKIAKYDIGITAGIETTVCASSWIEGLNRMDLNIVPSKFSKEVFVQTKYRSEDPAIGELELKKPIEVLFEGVDTNIYDRNKPVHTHINQLLKDIPESFAYLFVGHWLQGGLGQDRKDVGMLIKVFLETFKNKTDAPALILKTSGATFSKIDFDEIKRKISEIKSQIQANSLPNIYLIHGDLTTEEMNSLYNHEKIKAMVSFTKGEGFGRPLLEFTMSAKPVLVSGFGGHLDFLNKELTPLLPGKLEDVDASAVNDFIIKESKWFTVDYNVAAQAMMDIFSNYNKFLSLAKKQYYDNKKTYSLDQMTVKFKQIMNRYLPVFPEKVELNLSPSGLPKLKKI
jgi:hypothetical protein